ncbi:hypothetical protein G7Y79_00007g022340 [Physcia stellaris]|nr:hypothetical protein G7Y79_00007g022340 [Physcia stellaris]
MKGISPLISILALLTFLPYPGSSQGTNTSTSTSTSLRSDANTLDSITQLLSLFSIALDTKNFPALRDVFAPDAQLTGGGGAPTTGLPAIEDFYRNTFQNATLRTQHTSDTVLGRDFEAATAASTSYASAIYFGPKVLERGGGLFSNSSVVFREKFETEFVRVQDGSWRVSRQDLEILSIEGDISILPPL